jgi:hypothetical protein
MKAYLVVCSICPLTVRHPCHTSVLTGTGWVLGLFAGHPWKIWTELGVSHHVFEQLTTTVRGHLSVSLLPLSPLLLLFIYTSVPYLCTISRDYTYSWRLLSRRPDDFLDIDSPEVDDFHPLLTAWTWTAPHELRTHWDRSAWHCDTLCHHVDTHLWEAWW